MKPPVTIVSGLPRSGTSLVMQMLHAGGIPVLTDGLRVPDNDNPRGYFELESVKQIRTDKGWLDDASGKAVKIVHLLLMDLPCDREYRVIMLRRDMREVVRSQAKMLERLGRQGSTIAADRLGTIYETQLRTVGAWLKERPNFETCHLDYAAIVSDPMTAAATITEFLGMPLKVEAMAGVVDPNLYRNRSHCADGGE